MHLGDEATIKYSISGKDRKNKCDIVSSVFVSLSHSFFPDLASVPSFISQRCIPIAVKAGAIFYVAKSLSVFLRPFNTFAKSSILNVFQGSPYISVSFSLGKDIRQLSWMSHGVTRFLFLLNFLLISAFFDILASLSISRVFLSGISG